MKKYLFIASTFFCLSAHADVVLTNGTDTLEIVKNKFYVVATGSIQKRDLHSGSYKASEFALLNSKKNRVGFYGALTNCILHQDNDSLKIGIQDSLISLLTNKNRKVTLYTDIYYYANGKVAKKVSYNGKLSSYSASLIKQTGQKFLEEFVKDKQYRKLQPQEIYYWIQKLFLISLNEKDYKNGYLLNFPKYFKLTIDGELAETLHYYQDLLVKMRS